MAKLVLIRLKDEAVESFIAKGGSRIIGVWDIPTQFCGCNEENKNNWHRDPEQQRPVCNKCEKVHRVYLDYGPRVRWAFGRNLLKKLRGETE